LTLNSDIEMVLKPDRGLQL